MRQGEDPEINREEDDLLDYIEMHLNAQNGHHRGDRFWTDLRKLIYYLMNLYL